MAVEQTDDGNWRAYLPDHNILKRGFGTEQEAQDWENRILSAANDRNQQVISEREARLSAERIAHGSLDRDPAIYDVGETITASVQMRDGHGNDVSDVTQTVFLPVYDANGLQSKVIRIDIVDGTASRTLSIDTSGEYRVVPGVSNSGLRLDAPLDITIAE